MKRPSIELKNAYIIQELFTGRYFSNTNNPTKDTTFTAHIKDVGLYSDKEKAEFAIQSFHKYISDTVLFKIIEVKVSTKTYSIINKKLG